MIHIAWKFLQSVINFFYQECNHKIVKSSCSFRSLKPELQCLSYEGRQKIYIVYEWLGVHTCLHQMWCINSHAAPPPQPGTPSMCSCLNQCLESTLGPCHTKTRLQRFRKAMHQEKLMKNQTKQSRRQYTVTHENTNFFARLWLRNK